MMDQLIHAHLKRSHVTVMCKSGFSDGFFSALEYSCTPLYPAFHKYVIFQLGMTCFFFTERGHVFQTPGAAFWKLCPLILLVCLFAPSTARILKIDEPMLVNLVPVVRIDKT